MSLSGIAMSNGMSVSLFNGTSMSRIAVSNGMSDLCLIELYV